MSETELYLLDQKNQSRVNREPLECAQRLGLTLEGHGPITLLDIGSGIYAKFARAFVRANPGSSAVVVDPHFSSIERRTFDLSPALAREMEERYGPAPIAIGGYAERLDQIKDTSVDLITAVWSVPHYLPDGINAELVFSEILRVLKHGGKAVLVPILQFDRKRYSAAFKWLSERSDVQLHEEKIDGKIFSRLVINKL